MDTQEYNMMHEAKGTPRIWVVESGCGWQTFNTFFLAEEEALAYFQSIPGNWYRNMYQAWDIWNWAAKQIPAQFEYLQVMYQFKSHPAVPVFVTVLDAFEHRYTGTKMYHVRLEHDGTFGLEGNPSPFVEYKTFTLCQMVEMLGKRVKKG